MTFLKPAALLSVAAALSLAGCAGMGPNQQAGTAIGAVTGGLVGAVAGGNAGTTAVGAVAGGIVGGAIGQQLDRQAGELRTAFGDDRIGVVNAGDRLIVTMPDDILFATDSARLTGVLRSDLAVLAGHLNRYPDSQVRVIGHTDNTGAASYNRELSLARAQSVAEVLIANGVSGGRITTIGRGESQPVATNLTAVGRAQNRRVEIVIIPNAA